MLKQIDRYDYEGSELLFILNKEPAFLKELLQVVVDDLRYEKSDFDQLTVLWDLPDFLPAISEVFDQLITKSIYWFKGERVLDNLIGDRSNPGSDEKKLAFFEYYIHRNLNDTHKLNACFKIIQNKLYNHSDHLFKMFLTLHDDVKVFKKIRWTDQGTIIRSGDSIAGEIDERIWQKIKRLIDEIQPKTKFIEHKIFINQQIDYCRRSAVSERKWDFLRNR